MYVLTLYITKCDAVALKYYLRRDWTSYPLPSTGAVIAAAMWASTMADDSALDQLSGSPSLVVDSFSENASLLNVFQAWSVASHHDSL